MDYLESEYWNIKTANEQELQPIRIISTFHLTLQKDGDQFCYLYGENLQEGIAGFGDTPYQAAADFERNFNRERISINKTDVKNKVKSEVKKPLTLFQLFDIFLPPFKKRK